MRNGVPSGTPFCLRGLSGPAAAAGGRSPNLLGDGCGGPEAMPEMSAVADPAARVQRATCTREASPGMKAAGSTGYHEPRWLPGTLYRYTAAGIDVLSGSGEAMTGSRRSACDGAATHTEACDGAAWPMGGRGAGARRHLRKPRQVCESTVGMRARGLTGPLGSACTPARMGGVTRA